MNFEDFEVKEYRLTREAEPLANIVEAAEHLVRDNQALVLIWLDDNVCISQLHSLENFDDVQLTFGFGDVKSGGYFEFHLYADSLEQSQAAVEAILLAGAMRTDSLCVHSYDEWPEGRAS